jgi:excisionase family DNA binding protein
MTLEQIILKLQRRGYELQKSNELIDNKTALFVSKKFEVNLKKEKVGCELEFELIFEESEIVGGIDIINLSQKLLNAKPLLENIEKCNIDDIKNEFISEFNNLSKENSRINYLKENNSIIASLEGYAENDGLGLNQTLLLISFMTEMNNRMQHIEKLIEKSLSFSNNNDNANESDKLLVIDDIVKLLGLAKQTIYSKTNKKELPHFKRGNRIYFKESEIMEYINGGKILSNEEIEKKAALKLKKK